MPAWMTFRIVASRLAKLCSGFHEKALFIKSQIWWVQGIGPAHRLPSALISRAITSWDRCTLGSIPFGAASYESVSRSV
jgi:hypothetical protein